MLKVFVTGLNTNMYFPVESNMSGLLSKYISVKNRD